MHILGVCLFVREFVFFDVTYMRDMTQSCVCHV